MLPSTFFKKNTLTSGMKKTKYYFHWQVVVLELCPSLSKVPNFTHNPIFTGIANEASDVHGCSSSLAGSSGWMAHGDGSLQFVTIEQFTIW